MRLSTPAVCLAALFLSACPTVAVDDDDTTWDEEPPPQPTTWITLEIPEDEDLLDAMGSIWLLLVGDGTMDRLGVSSWHAHPEPGFWIRTEMWEGREAEAIVVLSTGSVPDLTDTTSGVVLDPDLLDTGSGQLLVVVSADSGGGSIWWDPIPDSEGEPETLFTSDSGSSFQRVLRRIYTRDDVPLRAWYAVTARPGWTTTA